MAKIIQARIDDETEQLLQKLHSYWGTNNSEIVREALRALAAVTPKKASKRFTGIGCVASGISDLASNKKHLRGFGS